MSQSESDRTLVRKLLHGLHKIEEWALTVLVLALVALAGAQIVLRNVFGGGISWADPFLRSLVLWTAMLGALAAVRDDKHIAVDVLQRYLPPLAQRIARALTLIFSAVICAAMAWYSLGLVSIDFAESSSTAAGDSIRALPGWVLETILPFGFAMMALRFIARVFAAPTHMPALMPELLHDPSANAAVEDRQA